MRKLLLTDEAVGLAAINAGIAGVYAYPGTPSTEITEYIQASPVAAARGIHSRWCCNEKTAMEAALGMSYAGKRALVCMKHVGMNVCADAFVGAALTGVNGGLVVVAADDPSMHSSQNEQDSRFYAEFAMVPLLEPSDQQEAYDMVGAAFDLSERLKLPVMLRLVTRLAHSRAAVEVEESPAAIGAHAPANGKDWVLIPAIARRRYAELVGKQESALAEAASSAYNRKSGGVSGNGVIACGIAFNYVMEALGPGSSVPVLKIGQYPIPSGAVRSFASACAGITVIEDGQPFAESRIRAMLGFDAIIHGRLDGTLPRTGELTPDNVACALGCGAATWTEADPAAVAGRPPQLCPGCGHRDVFAALGKVMADYPEGRVFGDIGCYTLGALPPFGQLGSCVDMGASITMAKGAADAGLFPAVAVIGDSTFTHSGMTGLLDAVNAGSPITVILSDNLTTAMTGGQDSAGTSKFEPICTALGVEPGHVRVVVPLPANMEEITRILREEIEYRGVSVIIPRRECMQTLRRNARK